MTSFCTGLISRKLCGILFFQQVLLHSLSYFFFLYQSPSSSLCMVFDSISSSIDEILSTNPSPNLFVFGDFNVHHKEWLYYSGGIDRPGELCYKFSTLNDLTQMVNFATHIPHCDSRNPVLLDFFISSDASIVLQWLSLHWEILIILLSQFHRLSIKFATGCPVSLHSL